MNEYKQDSMHATMQIWAENEFLQPFFADAPTSAFESMGSFAGHIIPQLYNTLLPRFEAGRELVKFSLQNSELHEILLVFVSFCKSETDEKHFLGRVIIAQALSQIVHSSPKALNVLTRIRDDPKEDYRLKGLIERYLSNAAKEHRELAQSISTPSNPHYRIALQKITATFGERIPTHTHNQFARRVIKI
ncbi:MAG: hypothetical protein ABIH99_02880 [Candidatus Micrarchaeota archaeon]